MFDDLERPVDMSRGLSVIAQFLVLVAGFPSCHPNTYDRIHVMQHKEVSLIRDDTQ